MVLKLPQNNDDSRFLEITQDRETLRLLGIGILVVAIVVPKDTSSVVVLEDDEDEKEEEEDDDDDEDEDGESVFCIPSGDFPIGCRSVARFIFGMPVNIKDCRNLSGTDTGFSLIFPSSFPMTDIFFVIFPTSSTNTTTTI